MAVQITDRYELELPALGRLILEDAETGEIVEINTGHVSSRDAFALRQEKQRNDLARQFRSSGVDAIQLRTDEPYSAALGNFLRIGKNGGCGDKMSGEIFTVAPASRGLVLASRRNLCGARTAGRVGRDVRLDPRDAGATHGKQR